MGARRGTPGSRGALTIGPVRAPDGAPQRPEVTITAATATVAATTVLDRQVDTLLALGYPALAGVGETELTDRLAPLREAAAALPDLPETDPPGRAEPGARADPRGRRPRAHRAAAGSPQGHRAGGSSTATTGSRACRPTGPRST